MSTQSKRKIRASAKRQPTKENPLRMMPFCKTTQVGTSGRYPIDFWAIKSTGDYWFDCVLGKQLGEDYLDYVAGHAEPGELEDSLRQIVNSMIEHGDEYAKGVRIGFLGVISRKLVLNTHLLAQQYRRHGA